MMHAGTLKMVGLTWLRYTKQMSYVATEAGRWRADVIGADTERMIEIEVKVSLSDLRSEFEHKSLKHAIFGDGGATTFWAPNRYFFLVPPELKDQAIALVEANAPRYGVLVCSEQDGGGFGEVPWKRVFVARSARALHDRKPSAALLEHISHRMASELCGFHMMREAYGNAFDNVRSAIQLGLKEPGEVAAGEAARV